MISAVIIYGEDYVIKDLYQKCLKSLSWVDEVVVINTKKSKKGSFSDWRNEGMQKAKGDWILYVDTDEEVTPTLKEEILTVTKKGSSFSAYAIPRRNIIWGKEFRHTNQWPDYQKRLFFKNNFLTWEGKLHEEPKFKGKLGHLKNPIIHHKDHTISEMLKKTNVWSEIEANLLYKSKHPPMNTIRFISVFGKEFIKQIFTYKAFLDGTLGIIYGMYQVYSKLITYTKLWEKQQSTTLT